MVDMVANLNRKFGKLEMKKKQTEVVALTGIMRIAG
jgi:hypothetical protein